MDLKKNPHKQVTQKTPYPAAPSDRGVSDCTEAGGGSLIDKKLAQQLSDRPAQRKWPALPDLQSLASLNCLPFSFRFLASHYN